MTGPHQVALIEGKLHGAVLALVLIGLNDEAIRAHVEQALIDGHELRDDPDGEA